MGKTYVERDQLAPTIQNSPNKTAAVQTTHHNVSSYFPSLRFYPVYNNCKVRMFYLDAAANAAELYSVATTLSQPRTYTIGSL